MEDWRRIGKESGESEIIVGNEGRMCIKWWRIIKWRIINGLRVKNKGEEGEERLKEMQRERNLCKSDCKIPDGNSGCANLSPLLVA